MILQGCEIWRQEGIGRYIVTTSSKLRIRVITPTCLISWGGCAFHIFRLLLRPVSHQLSMKDYATSQGEALGVLLRTFNISMLDKAFYPLQSTQSYSKFDVSITKKVVAGRYGTKPIRFLTRLEVEDRVLSRTRSTHPVHPRYLVSKTPDTSERSMGNRGSLR
jgi:hypothetical protein